VGGVGRTRRGRSGRRRSLLFLLLLGSLGCLDYGGGGLGGSCSLLGRLLRRLLRLNVALQALALCLATDAVGLCVLDARRVALDPDPERAAQIERLLVGEPELAR
jgi:hypothetical protein